MTSEQPYTVINKQETDERSGYIYIIIIIIYLCQTTEIQTVKQRNVEETFLLLILSNNDVRWRQNIRVQYIVINKQETLRK